MSAPRDRVIPLLTRHFVRNLFDLGFLSETGAATFTRTLIGIGATFLSFALLLLQVFAMRYMDLMAEGSAEPYRKALLADHAFLIAIPMWIVALVTVLVGHALFPDETDLRVLGPLPVERRSIFAGKLLAIALFTAGFVVAAQVALFPLFLLMGSGPWVEHAFPLRLVAHGIAVWLASAFAVLAVTATHGLLLIAVPRARAPRISAAFRSALLFALVLALPFLFRLSRFDEAFARADAWLSLVPSAWFLGVERLLLGDARLAGPAAVAAPALAVAAAVTATCYVIVYRRFDSVLVRPTASAARRWSLARLRLRQTPSRPVLNAIASFTAITLRRSPLHLGIVVVLSAIGAGLALNSLFGTNIIGWLVAGEPPSRRLITSITWVPFVLIFITTFAVRTAVLVPMNVRANWIFRVTEQGVARVDQLRAGVSTVARLGIITPVVVVFPLLWLALGPGAIGVAVSALTCGFVLHGILMNDWARIPFTCSYLPGKAFLPQIVIIGIMSFALFTLLGTAIARVAIVWHPAAWTANVVLGTVAGFLHWQRLRKWRTIPIDYEDELPTDVRSLKLYE